MSIIQNTVFTPQVTSFMFLSTTIKLNHQNIQEKTITWKLQLTACFLSPIINTVVIIEENNIYFISFESYNLSILKQRKILISR